MAFFRVETYSLDRFLFRNAVIPTPKRIVLRGRVVTMNASADVIADGMICVEQDRIVHVGAWSGTPPYPFDTALVCNTGGTIYPGLIELHNHPAYNAIPMWSVPRHFDNRRAWRSNDNYRRRVSNPANLLLYHPIDTYPKAVVRFVECRALLGGVTTTQGFLYKNGTHQTSYFEGLVRNAEFPNKGWPVADGYINDFVSKKDAADHLIPALGKHQPYIIHLTEGIDAVTRALFDYLQQPDGSWLIAPELITIHATALQSREFRILAQNNCGGVLWSPLSNFLLYGSTTRIDLAKHENLNIAIGCDWAPSGTKNLLGELKIAKLVSDKAGGLFTDHELAAAVTSNPARMLGWDNAVGTIEPNKTADLLVLDSTQNDPYLNLISADESNVIAVLIDGRPRAGRATLIDPRTPGVELVTVAGQNMVLDVVESAQHPLAGVTLGSATATLTDALARLPDVARQAQILAPLMKDAPDQWRPIPDYDDAMIRSQLFVAASLPGPNDVDPMALEGITAVDDAGFIPRIRSNVNVPQWLKDAL